MTGTGECFVVHVNQTATPTPALTPPAVMQRKENVCKVIFPSEDNFSMRQSRGGRMAEKKEEKPQALSWEWHTCEWKEWAFAPAFLSPAWLSQHEQACVPGAGFSPRFWIFSLFLWLKSGRGLFCSFSSLAHTRVNRQLCQRH